MFGVSRLTPNICVVGTGLAPSVRGVASVRDIVIGARCGIHAQCPDQLNLMSIRGAQWIAALKTPPPLVHTR